ncbi:hybrid sensor histidine kinase/response regulator [bacterium]|nr:MAG: hybrid sensor histidine kinase/response regulator [bacterium]
MKIGFICSLWALLGITTTAKGGLLNFINTINSFNSQVQPTQTDAVNFIVKNWTSKDGLPVNSFSYLELGSNGLIWIATYDGLVRFDGISFKTYSSRNYSAIKNNRFVNVFEAPNKLIYFFSEEGGLYVLNPDLDSVEQVLSDTNTPLYIHYISKGKNGNLYLASESGIWSVTTERNPVKILPNDIKHPVYMAYMDQFNRLWFINQNSQLYYIKDNQVKIVSISRPNSYLFFTLTENDHYGYLGWLNQIVYYDENQITVYDIDQISDKETFQRLVIETDNEHLIIHTSLKDTYRTSTNNINKLEKLPIHGYPILKHQKLIHPVLGQLLVTSEGLYLENGTRLYDFSTYKIEDALIDFEGSIWISTTGGGIFQLSLNHFKNYTFGLNAIDNNIFTVSPVQPDSSVFVGSYGAGLYQLNLKNGSTKPIKLHSDVQDKFVTSIEQLSTGSLLIGAHSYTIFELTPNKKVIQHHLPIKKNQTISALLEDNDGNIWVGSSDALYLKRKNTSSFSEAETYNLNFNAQIKTITQAPDQTIWLGTRGKGLIRLIKEVPEPILSNEPFSHAIIRSISLDPLINTPNNYRLWIATEALGIIVLDVVNQQIKSTLSLTLENGLLDNTIHHIVFDEKTNLWATTNRGLFSILSTELHEFVSGTIKQVNPSIYIDDDGLPDNEFNGGGNPSAQKIGKNQFLFANQKGLVYSNLSNLTTNSYIPSVIVYELKSNGTVVQHNKKNYWELANTQRNIEISFTSSSLASPKKNVFQYRLLPISDNWVDIRDTRELNFQNLSTGIYTLEIKGSNSSGLFSPSPTVVQFTIAPFWYETSWAYIFAFLFLIGASYSLVRLRVLQLSKRSARLQSLVDERTKELQNERELAIKQRNQLNEVLESRRLLLSQISFELKNPLTMIQSPLHLLNLNRYGTLPTEAKLVIDEVIRQTNNLDTHIKRIIDISSIHDGKFGVYKEKIISKPFFDSFFYEIRNERPEISTHHLSLTNKSNCEFNADPIQIRNGLKRVIYFFLDVTPDNKTIHFTCSNHSNKLVISVKIERLSPIILQQLHFDFEQSKLLESNQERLTNAITIRYLNELLSANGLNLTWDISNNQTFTCTFITDAENDGIYNDEESKSEIEVTPKSTINPDEAEQVEDKPLAVIVDDFGPFRLLAKETIKNEFRIKDFQNPLQALEFINETQPDIILTDLRMPEISGLELIKRIRNNKDLSGIPIILLSAVTDEVDQVKALHAGADIYLTKPFQPTVLLAQAKSLLAFRQRLRSSKFKASLSLVNYDEIADLKDREFVVQMIKNIELNLSNPEFNVEELAHQLSIDRSALFRKLKKINDKSPSILIQEMRIAKAKELLKSGKGNVSEVAYACGYNSLSYFSQAFKASTGKSPSEWLAETYIDK